MLREGENALGRPIGDAGAVARHLRSLAQASLETAAALAEGRIDAEAAREAFEGRRRLLVQMRAFAELAALQGAQSGADAIFRTIGRAVLDRTGINLVPDLVDPG
jgi:hypothetical protein